MQKHIPCVEPFFGNCYLIKKGYLYFLLYDEHYGIHTQKKASNKLYADIQDFGLFQTLLNIYRSTRPFTLM